MIDPRELALAADELPVAIWMGRVPSGEVVYTNAAFREVLGIAPPDGAVRGAFVEPYGVHTLTGEPYPEDKMPFERVIAARTTVVVEDLVIHRRDGRKVNLRVFAKPIFDAQGNLTHVLEAFTDITREIEAERARIEGERRLARAQRLEAIGQLVAGIAHDFNNLLTVTKLSVKWLRGHDVDAERQKALAQIDAVTDSAIELIRNLLGFARREKQMMAPTSLERVATNVVEMARRTFDPAIAIRTELANEALVLGDASQLEQLVMNLVLNARDAITGEGEVVVRTATSTIDQDGGPIPAGRFVVLEISDTGAGIDPAIRDRIFEPYFTTKTQGSIKGTGLGLATVHGIVQTHRGFIDVSDNPGGGTIMRVTLPQPPPVPWPTSSRPQPTPLAKHAPAHGKDRLVLLIDDEPLVRAATAASLRELGLRVCDVGDGASGLDMFTTHHRELAGVILDMVMPGLRGREVLRKVRELRPDLPVLLVTGSADTTELEEIRGLGVAGVLSKPYDDKELAAALEQAGVL